MPTIRNHRRGAIGPIVVKAKGKPNVSVTLQHGDNVISDEQAQVLATSLQAQAWFTRRWIEVVRDAPPPTDLAEALTDDSDEDLPPAA